jgi:amidase
VRQIQEGALEDIWRLSATELAQNVRDRKISAREAAQAALERLEAVNPAINAVIDYRAEDVLAQADAVDASAARGEEAGVLAGVPVTVKVNLDQENFATTNGTRLQARNIAGTDSPVVANLRRAGAVILGRTNTPAFSLRWFTDNLLHGATKNPRDPSRTAGGSSGGAASAVAAGIGHLAHGTDIAGSIRYPAYACGVHGLRPSLGRVPTYNASGPERPIGVQLTAVSGPIGRSIADLRLGLAAMSGFDPRDPWWVPAPLEFSNQPRRAALVRRPGGLEIVPEVEEALVDAAARLRDSGWEVAELDDIPAIEEAVELQARLWIGESFTPWEEMTAKDGDPGAIATIAELKSLLKQVSPETYLHALVRRSAIIRDYQLLLQDHPVLLLPVSAELPFPDQLDRTDFARVWRAQLTQIGLPLTGLPALAVSTARVGRTTTGVQLLAGRFREDLLLEAGEVLEAGGTPPAPLDPVF